MKCQECAKTATLHITEIVKGTPHEVHLCEDCAQGYLDKQQSEIEVELADDVSPGDSANAELDETNQLVCPTCSSTFGEFRQAGRLGCPHCYAAFREQLLPLLENVHGETRHLGKFPRRAPHDSSHQFELIKLRNELRLAVDEERYEVAARLRDQIQSLEAMIAASGEQEPTTPSPEPLAE